MNADVGCARRRVVEFFLWSSKAAALWLVLLAATVMAGRLVSVDMPAAPQDGPLTTLQALLAVNALWAVSLSLVAGRARRGGWHLALVLFVSQFAISCAMMQIETVYFNASVRMPLAVVGQLTMHSAIVAGVVALAGALLFRPAREDAAALPSVVVLRIAAMAAIYVCLYYAAGFFIAWQSAAVRAFYEEGVHIALAPTVALQLVRGTLWALIALFILRSLKGPLAQRALIIAVLFSTMTAAGLLYPNPLMPWAVRQVHLLEIASSEFAYGIIAAFVLMGRSARRCLPNTSLLPAN